MVQSLQLYEVGSSHRRRRSRSLPVYNNEFILGNTCIGSNQGSKSMGRGRAASGSEFFVFQRDSAPSHRAKDTVAHCLIKKCPILSHPLSGRLTYRTSTRLTIPCGVCFRSETIVPRSRRLGRRTETTHQQRVGRFESHGYWMCCWRVASASMRLCSCWRQTLWAHAVIKTMRMTFLRDTETITASHVCRYSVNYSNVHLIIALMAQSDTSDFPR